MSIRKCAVEHPEMEFLFTDIEELDISSYDAIEQKIKKFRPQIIINCASYNAVDQAEDDPKPAIKINSNAVQSIAGLARKYNIGLIHLSTDYIFDGKKGSAYTELDDPNPQSKYAHSKYIGEQAVQTATPRAAIIRTSWLYSEYGHNFVKTIRRLASERDELKVVNDQLGTPTYAGDLAEVILSIIPNISDFDGVNVFNYSNEGLTNWAEFAEAIIKFSGFECKVNAVSTEEYGYSKAKRPTYSLLDKKKIKETFNLSIPGWKESLKKCIETIEKENSNDE